MKKFNRWEQGQVVVIVVLGVTALLAFTALALDGGQYYADRRHTQNAADDAALAGAGKIGDILAANGISTRNFSCSNPVVSGSIPAGISAAQYRAQQNGFTIDDDLINAQHGVEITCNDASAKQLKIRVKIISDVSTSFLHMIFSAILRNTVEAVTIVEPGKGLGDGMAVVSLETEGCGGQYGGIFFGGSGTSPEVAKITINNSGAHSNSCIRCQGSSVTIDADKPLELADSVESASCRDTSIWGEGLAVSNEVVEAHYPEFKCGTGAYVSMPAYTASKLTLEPGNYNSIKVTNNQILTLKPGLYCVSGVLDVGGSGSIVVEESAADPYKDDGVTLYVNGSVNINGGGTVFLRAPRSVWTGAKPASLSYTRPSIAGLLLFVKPSGPSVTVTLNGNTGNIFRGSVYFPEGEVVMSGNNDSAQWYVDIVAKKVTMSGSANINITYDGANGHPGFPYITVTQ